MKVLMIDPWGTGNTSIYLKGICSGISNYVDLTLVTNYYFENTFQDEYNVNNVFFKISEKMIDNKLRKVIRGIEYVMAYHKIIKDIKKNKYDIVHIQWLLMYKLDVLILKKVKRYCNKVVYTAHNVLPHVHGERYIKELKTIYGLVDKIILHGDSIKREFKNFFEEYSNKVIIQRHGTYLNQKTEYNIDAINIEIINKINRYEKIFVFFGNIFYNKGVDRLLKIWLENFKNTNFLLIIAGKKIGEYKELDALETSINQCDNLLYISKFVEDNLLNYLINKSDIILLPYRHASMSGVIFTAAEFKKTVLCTDTGAIREYVLDKENCFIVKNRDELFCDRLKYIANEVSKETLKEMGVKLYKYIISNYSWSNIGKKLTMDVYENGINTSQDL